MENTMTATKRGFFYGWWIVVVATFMLMVTNGLAISGLPVFFKPMLTELGPQGQAPQIGVMTSLTFLVSGFVAPLAGQLVGRVNVRVLMTIGCVLLGGGLIVWSQAAKPLHFYLAHFLFGLTLCFASILVLTVVVSNWFRRLRGTAMGIVITGTSLGTVFIPLVGTKLIAAYGWRTAVLIISGVVLLILIPAIWLIVRIHPNEMGLTPDGDLAREQPTVEAAAATPQSQTALPGMTLREALRTPMFWVFSLCAMTLFYSILATVQQLVLYLQQPKIGMSAIAAAGVQSAMGTASIFGKFGFGGLSDRLPKALVNVLCCLLLCPAAFLLLNLRADTALAFAIPFGLGYGGAFVMVQLLVAECFGLKELGKILGVITVVETAGGALGNYLTGELTRRAGNDYTVGFYGVFIATVIALLASLLLLKLVPAKKK